MHPARIALLVAVFATIHPLALAQSKPTAAADVAGRWNGSIEIPGAPLEIEINLKLDAERAWAGTITIPAQKAKDLPLEDVAVDGRALRCRIAGVGGKPTFKGEVDDAGAAIKGQFTQGGLSFPFHLDREAASTKAGDEFADLDRMIEHALAEFETPGLGLAIVKRDRTIHARGFGFRDVEQHLAVTPQTLFAIGSSSKAFTTLVLATLVDEGRLDWEVPLRRYWPDFALKDEVLAAHVTARDLVTHRTGLPRHDLVWYNADVPRAELVKRLAFLDASKDLRAAWQYNNLALVCAGYLAERITGSTWEDLVRARIFAPLGMTRSNFSVQTSQQADNHALPYDWRDQQIKKIPFRDISIVGPAGSINSSVEEMARWLALHLSDGSLDGKRVVSAGAMTDLHQTRMAIGGAPEDPAILATGYACGWFTDVYRGHRRVHHGGNIDGFTSAVEFLPDDGYGVVALSNRNGDPLPEIAAQTVFDRLLKLEKRDWMGEALAKRKLARAATAVAESRKSEARKPGTKPAHALAEYAGEYEHPGYGTIAFRVDGERLVSVYNRIETPLEHWHYEVFSGLKNDADPTFDGAKVIFETGLDGDVAAVRATMDPLVEPIIFRRKPDPAMKDPLKLAAYAGRYAFATETATVTVKGQALEVEVKGQPTFALVAVRKDVFDIKDLPGFQLRFTRDATGQVTEAVFHQPNGVFPFARQK